MGSTGMLKSVPIGCGLNADWLLAASTNAQADETHSCRNQGLDGGLRDR